jgi:hypothetical protein
MKKILLIALISLTLTSISFAYDLKSNMMLLNAELSEVQRTLIASDKNDLKLAVERFSKHALDLLGNKKEFAKMLPDNKKSKANEAVMAAQIIKFNTQIIQDAIANRYNKNGQQRREEAQRAYTYIEHACFRCHNIVRDNY